jgi:hypothetical protein
MTRTRRTRTNDARRAAPLNAAPQAATPPPPQGFARRRSGASSSGSSVASSHCSFVASSRRPFVASFVTICFALAATHARAATLDDYRARVRDGVALVAQLGGTFDPEEWASEDERARAEAEAVGKLRARLPQRERVERAGGAVEVDNTWLHKELDAYAALSPARVDEKRRKIAYLRERLTSLAARLDEEAAAVQQAARDKEAEKGRLQSILRRPEYHEEAAKGGAFEKLMEWLSNLIERLFPKRTPISPGASSLFSLIARVFVYALALGLIAFLAWRYGPLLWGRAATARRAKAREARVVLGERLAPDETSSDLIAEAERLARAGDLRGAIRKAYVAVLCELGDRRLIRLAQHKTNRDYLAALRDRSELYGVMHPLTHAFERHWYGLVPASDADWADYRAMCNRAISDE